MDQDLMSDDDFLDVDTDDDMPSLASEDAFGSDAESYAGGRHQDLLSDVSSVLGDQDLLSDVSSVLGDPVPAVLPDVLAVPAVLPDVKPKRLSRKEMAVHIKLGKARFAKLNRKVNRIMNEQAAQLSEFASQVKRRGRRATLLVKKKTKRCRTTGLKVSVRWKGQRTARDVCYTTMREIAYDKDNMHLKPLAASFSLSHAWVAILQQFVAMTYLMCQNLLIGALLALCVAHPPLFVLCRTKWDETGEKVTLSHGNAFTPEQTRGTWTVLVARMTLVVGWLHTPRVAYITLVFPPLLLLSTGAHHMWAALFRHKLFAPVFEARRRMLDLATYAVDLNETDAAYGNERLLAHLLAQSPHLLQWVLCGCHQTQLIDTALLATVGLQLLSRWYSVAMFLRSGCNYSRMVRSVADVVREDLVVRMIDDHGPPPPNAALFANEVLRYIASHYKRFEASAAEARRVHHWLGELDSDSESEGDFVPEDGAAGAPQKNRGLKQLLANMALLLGVLNGPWWEGPIHDCSGPGCCPNGRATAVSRAVDAIRKVVFVNVPQVPSANKWTKLGSCVDSFQLGLWCCMMFLRCFLKGLGKLKFDSQVPEHDVDNEMMQDVCFSAVLGKRYQATLRFLYDRAGQTTLRILVLPLEITRYFSAWFMRRGREVFDDRQVPAACDMARESCSPVILALQYASTLLCGRSSRLRLVFAPLACDSVQAWYEGFPDQVRLLRRLILVVAGSIHRRGKLYRSWAILLVGLADPRLSSEEKSALRAEFRQAHPCCIPAGLARKLHQRGFAAEELDEGATRFLLYYALVLTMQCADLEWRHGRHRRRSHQHGQSR